MANLHRREGLLPRYYRIDKILVMASAAAHVNFPGAYLFAKQRLG